MSEEELKNSQNSANLLITNGIIIKNPSIFISATNGQDFANVIDRLNVLEDKMSEKIDVDSFVKDMVVGIYEIESVFETANYVDNNTEISFFKRSLATLKEKFNFAEKYLRANKIAVDADVNYDNVLNDIDNLVNEPDDNVRTRRTFELLTARENARISKENSAKLFEEQKELYESEIKNLDFELFREELITSVENLEKIFRRLISTMNSDVAEKLGKVISKVKDNVYSLGEEIIKSKEEYALICKEYGIEKTKLKNNIKEDKTDEVVSKKDTESISSISDFDTQTLAQEIIEDNPFTPVEVEEQVIQNNTIKTQEELINSIINDERNAHINFVVKTIEKNGKEEKILTTENEVSEIYLPEGFVYTDGIGFNNKKNDQDEYLVVDVRNPLSLDNNLDNTSDNQRIGDGFIENLNNGLTDAVNLFKKKDSKVPSGKLEVTKERKAVMDAYAHTTLMSMAIPTIATAIFGVGLSPVVTAAILSAGFGVAIQALYNKLVKGTTLSIKAFEKAEDYNENPEHASVFMTLLSGGAPQLMEIYKQKRRMNKMQQLNNQQPTLSDTQENDMSVDLEVPSEIIPEPIPLSDIQAEELNDSVGGR